MFQLFSSMRALARDSLQRYPSSLSVGSWAVCECICENSGDKPPELGFIPQVFSTLGGAKLRGKSPRSAAAFLLSLFFSSSATKPLTHHRPPDLPVIHTQPHQRLESRVLQTKEYISTLDYAWKEIPLVRDLPENPRILSRLLLLIISSQTRRNWSSPPNSPIVYSLLLS